MDAYAQMNMQRMAARIRHLEAQLDAAAADRDMWREHCTAQAKLIAALTDAPSKHVVVLDGPQLMDAVKTQMITYHRRNGTSHLLGVQRELPRKQYRPETQFSAG